MQSLRIAYRHADESGPRGSGSRGGGDDGEERSMDWADLNADTQRVLRGAAAAALRLRV